MALSSPRADGGPFAVTAACTGGRTGVSGKTVAMALAGLAAGFLIARGRRRG